jgi:hypothetical protein
VRLVRITGMLYTQMGLSSPPLPQVFEDAVQEWQDQKAVLEAQRAQAMAALNQSRVSSRPSSACSRPVSAHSRPISASSRPPSARPPSARLVSALSSGRTSQGGQPVEAQSSGTSLSRPTSATPRPLSASRQASPRPARPQGLPTHPENGPPAAAAAEVPEQPGLPAAAAFDNDDSDDGGIIQEEEGDELGDLGEPPGLDLEDSQELKRAMFPEEVVAALDDANAAALDTIRDEWEKLLQDTEARNRKKLEVLEK